MKLTLKPFLLATLVAWQLPFFAQSNDVTLSVLPTVAIPLGPTLSDGLAFYSIGGGATIRAEMIPAFSRNVFGRLFLDYELLPVNGSSSSVSFVYGGSSVGAAFNPTPRMSVRASAGGGLYMATSAAGTVRNPFVEGGGEMIVRITPTIATSLGGRYKYLTSPGGVLYQGLALQIGLVYDLAGSKKGTSIRIEPQLRQIFPLFYSYYDDNSFGDITLTNDENLSIDKVKVEFYARQYMDTPKLCAEIASIAPGASRTVPALGLFNDNIFDITEGTKTAGEIRIEYFYLGRKTTQTIPVTVLIQNRNALTWDDDRKAAAFVTAKDPQVLGFAKSIAAMVRMDKSMPAVTNEFRTAVAIYQAMGLYGIGYAVDPSTPFQKLSENRDAIDFLQFPGQTLSYRAGDCDDLSVLYAALLESVGIETALITVPGHIFVAFNPGLSLDNASRYFADAQKFIVADGKAWIPVEVTLVKDGFIRSWNTGAAEWEAGAKQQQAKIYPVHDAWQTYEPVGFTGSSTAIVMPGQRPMKESFLNEMERLSRAETSDRAAALQKLIRNGVDVNKNTNKLGILYAKFGLLEEARSLFLSLIKRSNPKEALINMGNIEYLQDNLNEAKKYYLQALASSPGDSGALIALARTYLGLGETTAYRNTLGLLIKNDPEAAATYFPESAASSKSRQSDSNERKVEEWTE